MEHIKRAIHGLRIFNPALVEHAPPEEKQEILEALQRSKSVFTRKATPEAVKQYMEQIRNTLDPKMRKRLINKARKYIANEDQG